MYDFLSQVETLEPQATYAQLASNGNWERATRLKLDGQMHKVQAAIHAFDASVAGEVFYRLKDGRTLFFGLRYASTFIGTSSPDEFMRCFYDCLTNAAEETLSEFLDNLGEKLNNDKQTFKARKLDYAELGVEGHWKSMDSFVMRKSSEAPLTIADLETMLNKHPTLARNSTGHIALELAVNTPEYWIGIDVSKQVGEDYVVQPKQLLELVNMF